jgi:toxin FitB
VSAQTQTSSGATTNVTAVYLVDTDVISELRRGARADRGVREFFRAAAAEDMPLYLSVITVGELRRGVELIRYRGDKQQADRLEQWLLSVVEDFDDFILSFGVDEAHVWGKLRAPHHENALDKQIAATAAMHGLAVLTGNDSHFANLGVATRNPFKRGHKRG